MIQAAKSREVMPLRRWLALVRRLASKSSQTKDFSNGDSKLPSSQSSSSTYVDDEPTAPGVYLRSEGDNSPSPEPRIPLGFLPAFFAADDSTTSKEAKAITEADKPAANLLLITISIVIGVVITLAGLVIIFHRKGWCKRRPKRRYTNWETPAGVYEHPAFAIEFNYDPSFKAETIDSPEWSQVSAKEMAGLLMQHSSERTNAQKLGQPGPCWNDIPINVSSLFPTPTEMRMAQQAAAKQKPKMKRRSSVNAPSDAFLLPSPGGVLAFKRRDSSRVRFEEEIKTPTLPRTPIPATPLPKGPMLGLLPSTPATPVPGTPHSLRGMSLPGTPRSARFVSGPSLPGSPRSPKTDPAFQPSSPLRSAKFGESLPASPRSAVSERGLLLSTGQSRPTTPSRGRSSDKEGNWEMVHPPGLLPPAPTMQAAPPGRSRSPSRSSFPQGNAAPSDYTERTRESVGIRPVLRGSHSSSQFSVGIRGGLPPSVPRRGFMSSDDEGLPPPLPRPPPRSPRPKSPKSPRSRSLPPIDTASEAYDASSRSRPRLGPEKRPALNYDSSSSAAMFSDGPYRPRLGPDRRPQHLSSFSPVQESDGERHLRSSATALIQHVTANAERRIRHSSFASTHLPDDERDHRPRQLSAASAPAIDHRAVDKNSHHSSDSSGRPRLGPERRRSSHRD